MEKAYLIIIFIGSLTRQPRATTAIGVNEIDSKYKKKLATPKSRRILGSAHAGKRRKMHGKPIGEGIENGAFDEDPISHTLNSNFINGQPDTYNEMSNEFSHKMHMNEADNAKSDICGFNRPPSRQKEPSLALGIGSEYGEDDDDEAHNKISNEIVITSGIPEPVNNFNSKFTPAQGKHPAGIDLRPPSRQKTPTKAVGLDDQSHTSHSPGDYETSNPFAYKNQEIPKDINPRLAARKVARIDPKSKKNQKT